eukprot:Rhum_TRINITY_DN14740_c10_g1::Rhum_TRINITY_DN14740_c10_g1_i1::g.114508::m.114508
MKGKCVCACVCVSLCWVSATLKLRILHALPRKLLCLSPPLLLLLRLGGEAEFGGFDVDPGRSRGVRLRGEQLPDGREDVIDALLLRRWDVEAGVARGRDVGVEDVRLEAHARVLVLAFGEHDLDVEHALLEKPLRLHDAQVPHEHIVRVDGTPGASVHAVLEQARVLVPECARDVAFSPRQLRPLLLPRLRLLVQLRTHAPQPLKHRLVVEAPLRQVGGVLEGCLHEGRAVLVQVLLRDLHVRFVAHQELPLDLGAEVLRLPRKHGLHHVAHGHAQRLVRHLVAVRRSLRAHVLRVPPPLLHRRVRRRRRRRRHRRRRRRCRRRCRRRQRRRLRRRRR